MTLTRSLFQWFCLSSSVLWLAACSSQYVAHDTQTPQVSNAGRYSMDQDRAPDRTLTADQIREASPRMEPLSRHGNASPYTVNGRRYHVMASADNYREEGLASWYGAKFHGHTTSNGEVFDMYEISAAHKALPLPTWVRVTNLENGLSIVARVNDRGPFHPGRIIDLSYAAAVKLDFVHKGTARVRVEALQGPELDQPAYFVQLGAFSQRQGAENLRQRVSTEVSEQVQISQGDFYRVRVGPVRYERAVELQRLLDNRELGKPLLVIANE
ncbi:MAG: septal ring lytic transglycosylase RlpA family protein [Saccharospirillum sp.]